MEKVFSMGKKSTGIPFSMKIKMMDLRMQIEGTKQIFIMNFSVLDFFKFASRLPQIAQVKLVSTVFDVWVYTYTHKCNLNIPLQ